MIEQSQLVYFVAASAALTILPSPDILFVLTQSISQGKKAGVATALGYVQAYSFTPPQKHLEFLPLCIGPLWPLRS